MASFVLFKNMLRHLWNLQTCTYTPELSSEYSLWALDTPGISYRARTSRYYEIKWRHKYHEGRRIGWLAKTHEGFAFLNTVGTNDLTPLARGGRTCQLSQLIALISRPPRVKRIMNRSALNLRDLCAMTQANTISTWYICEKRIIEEIHKSIQKSIHKSIHKSIQKFIKII